MSRVAMGRSIALALLLVTIASVPREVHAQDAYGCIDELSDAEVDVRLRWIEAKFDKHKKRTRAWWYGWMFGNLALAVGQTVLAVVADDEKDIVAGAVGAGGSFATALSMAILPMKPAYAPQRLAGRPDRTPEERREKLRYATELLEDSAEGQAFGTSALAHVPGGIWTAVNVPLFRRRYDANFTAVQLGVGGLLLTEARLLTTPTSAVRNWERYRGFACGARYVQPDRQRLDMYYDEIGIPPQTGPEISVAPAPGGVGLALRW